MTAPVAIVTGASRGIGAHLAAALEDSGYAGWYVLEQDTILTGPPAETGVDPTADVRTSIAHITAIAHRLGSRSHG